MMSWNNPTETTIDNLMFWVPGVYRNIYEIMATANVTMGNPPRIALLNEALFV